jgi:2-methylaconitate cis-trans-isomerase PrpF
MGGGLSSLSKICVVGKSKRDDSDVDYTFVAIGVKNDEVDYSSNCGNMTSAVGPFAIDSGLFSASSVNSATVRIHNTNTGKLIDATFPVVDGEAAASGSFAIDGVAGTASQIELGFKNPAGSKTGKLLPTGNVFDVFDGVEATCVDVGNPCVFVRASSLGVDGSILPDSMEAHDDLLSQLDSIRRQAGVAMGLCETTDKTPPSIPKICMVSPRTSQTLLSGEAQDAGSIDLIARAISVGQPHRAVPITVSLSLAVASKLPGSVVADCVASSPADADGVTIGHPSGKIMVNAKFSKDGSVESAVVYRTARRLMEGKVYWK